MSVLVVSMRDLQQKYKLTFRSTPEVNEVLGQLVVALRARGPAFRGKRASQEAILNALILAMDEDTARPLVERGLARLESILRGESNPGRPGFEAKGLGSITLPGPSGDEPDDADAVPKPGRGMRRPER